MPGRLVAAVPLECRAAIQRRAVVPLGGLGGLDLLMLGQQLLEPADVPLDDRADEDQRRVLIAGRRGDLAIGHKLEAADIAQRQVISALIPELVADAVAQRIEGMEEGIEFRVEVRLDTALTQQPDEADDFRITQAASRSRTFSNSAQRASNQRQPSALSSSRRTITAG